MNRICIVIPTHPPHFHFFYKFLETYAKNEIFREADLLVVISNEAEHQQFVDKFKPVLDQLPLFSTVIVPPQLRMTAATKPHSNRAVVKKFYGLLRAFEKNYEYVLCFDDETTFVARPSLYLEIHATWIKGTVCGTKNNHAKALEINRANKKLFTEDEQLRLPGDNDYFWFNNVPIYERRSFLNFAQRFQLEKFIGNLPDNVYEYIAYAYYCMVCGLIKYRDLTIEGHVPADLSNNSFLEDLTIIDRNYIQAVQEIDPLWLPLQTIELRHHLTPRVFLSFHNDRIWSDEQILLNQTNPESKIMRTNIDYVEFDDPPEFVDASNQEYAEQHHDYSIAYKYREAAAIEELQAYVDSTYGEHYAQGKIQTTEFIIDLGDGIPFTRGNVIKYAQRYGKKGGRNRKDILKILHYALIMLYVHDTETGVHNAD